MKLPEEAEYIRQKIQDAVAWSFESYSFSDVINDTELSDEEKEWALENITWGISLVEDADIWSPGKAVDEAKETVLNTVQNLGGLWGKDDDDD